MPRWRCVGSLPQNEGQSFGAACISKPVCWGCTPPFFSPMLRRGSTGMPKGLCRECVSLVRLVLRRRASVSVGLATMQTQPGRHGDRIASDALNARSPSLVARLHGRGAIDRKTPVMYRPGPLFFSRSRSLRRSGRLPHVGPGRLLLHEPRLTTA